MPRYHPSRRPTWAVVLVLALLLIWRFSAAWREPQAPRQLPEAPPEGGHNVERIVDGDTLIIDGQRVRLIGVNAPESVRPDHPVEPFGPEASEFTRRFVASGAVRLQFDKERVDRYDRLLAYVWVEDQMLNEELVRAGLARVEFGHPYSDSVKRRYRQALDEAKRARRGIWGGGR
jgi:micrococcal nuclease